MKISVIMASYLGEYSSSVSQSATNREFKFQRAVDSFLIQKHEDSELIVVSDGCEKTIEIINRDYGSLLEEKIKLITIKKQPAFSGAVRAKGLRKASGDLVCYLDSDDMIGPYHLEVMNIHYDKSMDWMYYDDFLYDGDAKIMRSVTPHPGKIGTSSFCHKLSIPVDWQDGYGHDWATIANLFPYKYAKMQTPEYLVCHLSAINLDF